VIVELVAFAFFVLAVAMHELGHVIILSGLLDRFIPVKFNKKGLCIEVGEETDYNSISNLNCIAVYCGGIAAGFAPLLIALLVLPSLHFGIIGLLYLWGCKHDIKTTYKLL